MNKKLIGYFIGGLLVLSIGGYLLAPSLFGGGDQIGISGAGSSFVNPLMTTWASQYSEVDSSVRIDYASIGSGGGIRQLSNRTVDFGASDAPLSAEEYNDLGNAVHIPVTVGGIVLAYNVPGFPDGIHLTGYQIADIFLGKITSWNDPAIQQENPDLTLPNKEIVVVHRSDGSGTTYAFTDYLAHVSSDWASSKGVGKSIDWSVGIGAKGNEGVTASIKQTEYSIGYIELSYAMANQFNTVAIENQVGEYVQANITSIQKAMDNSASSLPKGEESWENVTLVDAPGSGSYPIASFTYVLVYKDLNNVADFDVAQKLVDFLWWAVHEGQDFSAELYYVPLSSAVIQINERSLGLLTFNGEALTLPTS